jgi:hypothetical protein
MFRHLLSLSLISMLVMLSIVAIVPLFHHNFESGNFLAENSEGLQCNVVNDTFTGQYWGYSNSPSVGGVQNVSRGGSVLLYVSLVNSSSDQNFSSPTTSLVGQPICFENFGQTTVVYTNSNGFAQVTVTVPQSTKLGWLPWNYTIPTGARLIPADDFGPYFFVINSNNNTTAKTTVSNTCEN